MRISGCLDLVLRELQCSLPTMCSGVKWFTRLTESVLGVSSKSWSWTWKVIGVCKIPINYQELLSKAQYLTAISVRLTGTCSTGANAFSDSYLKLNIFKKFILIRIPSWYISHPFTKSFRMYWRFNIFLIPLAGHRFVHVNIFQSDGSEQ